MKVVTNALLLALNICHWFAFNKLVIDLNLNIQLLSINTTLMVRQHFESVEATYRINIETRICQTCAMNVEHPQILILIMHLKMFITV